MLALVLLTDLFRPATLSATDFVWTNRAGGVWNLAANWSPNQVPGAADNAWLTNNGTYTVTNSANATVTGLMLGGVAGAPTLDLSSGTLTLTGSGGGSPQAVLRISGGTLAGPGLLALAGPLNWTAGVISGWVQCNGGTISGSNQKDLDGGRLINSGLLAMGTTAPVRTYSGSVISNLAGATFDLTVDGGYELSGLVPAGNHLQLRAFSQERWHWHLDHHGYAL